MEWIIENWGMVVALLIVVIGGVVGVLRIVKPQSPWLSILLYILSVIEDLAPELSKKVKGEVKAKMLCLPAKDQIALNEACATVDAKKQTPESIKKAL
jgi:hypothetical protein